MRVRVHADEELAQLLNRFHHRLGRAAMDGTETNEPVVGGDFDNDLGRDGKRLGRHGINVFQRHRERVRLDGFYFHHTNL